MMKGVKAVLLAALLFAGGAHAGEARIGEPVALPVLSTFGGGAIDPAALRGKVVVQVIDRQGVLRQVEVGEMLDEDFDDIAAFAARE
jgi:hypothetical protein